jgi:hypothetical protein
MSGSEARNYWLIWLSVFGLASVGATVVFGGLDFAAHDRDPLLAFLGFWIANAAFLVAPGAIVGAIVTLVSTKPLVGGRVMIGVNSLMLLVQCVGAILQAKS